MKRLHCPEPASLDAHPARRFLTFAAVLLAVSLASCASPGIFTESGRDSYYGGHGLGGTNGHFVPREVQRVEPLQQPR